MKRSVWLLSGALPCLLALTRCSVTEDGSCHDDLTCPRPADGGLLDATAPEGDSTTTVDAPSGNEAGDVDATTDAAPSCDPSQTPSQNACVISDSLAVFVSPTGSDATGTGTMESPVATLAKGISLAAGTTTHRVIACAGTYAESVTLGTAQDVGLQIFGGVTCPGSDAGAAWSYTGAKTVAAPSAHGYALSASSLTQALRIEDFEFDAQNGTAAGESSIAGFFANAPNVTLRRVKLAAGTGVKGADGTLTDVVFPTATRLQGGAGAGLVGGPGCALLACPAGGTTSGGTGGIGGGVAGGDGSAGTPALGGGAGQSAIQCNSGTGGPFPGTAAAASGDGAGATVRGTLSASNAWTPASGAGGAYGAPGQGGGGGGGAAAGGGGGGGCGGCGGAAGTGGGGGGASIGLLVVGSASTITLDTCDVIATTAGAGGMGVAGQLGQTPGGVRGLASQTGGCSGGNGGAGGKGGGGGGGAGGVSVGILYQGAEPTLTSTTPTAAASVAGGGAGAGTGNGGVVGVSAATMSL